MPKYDELYKQVADALRHTYPQTHAEELLQVFNEAIDLAESSDTFPNTAEIVEDDYYGDGSSYCSKCGALLPYRNGHGDLIEPSSVCYCYSCGAKFHPPKTITVNQFAQFLQEKLGNVPVNYPLMSSIVCDKCQMHTHCGSSCWRKVAEKWVDDHTEKGSN